MKHLNIRVISIVFLFIVLTSSGQSGHVDFKIGSGIHMEAFKATGLLQREDALENIHYSMGSGVPVFVGIGIPTAKLIELNFDFNYRFGTEVTINDTDRDLYISKFLVKSNQFCFMPGLTLKSESGLYSRYGLALLLGGAGTFEHKYNEGGAMPPIEYHRIQKMKYAFSLGAQTALGYSVRLPNDTRLFGELQIMALQVQNSISEVTKYTQNGDDITADMDEYDLKQVYVDRIDENSNNSSYNPDYDPGKPAEALATRYPSGSWGINLGVVIPLR